MDGEPEQFNRHFRHDKVMFSLVLFKHFAFFVMNSSGSQSSIKLQLSMFNCRKTQNDCIMRQNHFLVSIKTVDDTPLFPKSFNGEMYLFHTVISTASRIGVFSKGFASFPTGVEAVICCNDVKEAKKFADGVSNQLYAKTNSLGYIIESFGIHIGELTDDERTLEAVMMDMMMRSMASRGVSLDDVPTIKMDMDGKIVS